MAAAVPRGAVPFGGHWRLVPQDKTRVDRFVLDLFLFGDYGVDWRQIVLSTHLRPVSRIIEERDVAFDDAIAELPCGAFHPAWEAFCL
jgi:hypothetical protein